MVPVFLSRKEIDDSRWNEAIESALHPVMYGFTWYLDAVCEDWSAIVWPSGTDFQVILPLPLKTRWSIRMVHQPFFCQYLGFFYKEVPSEQTVSDFLTLTDSKFPYISTYHFHPENTALIMPVLDRFGNFKQTTCHTHWLRLNQPYAALSGQYSSDRKSNLKKAFTQNWTAFESTDLTQLITWFKQYHEPAVQGGVAKGSYDILHRLYKSVKDRIDTKIIYAGKDGVLHAGILVMRGGNMAVYLFNAADDEGRSGNARTFLLDQYFRNNAGTDLIFDFESPPVESIASFYKSFGSEKVPFINIHKNSLPFPCKVLQRWRRAYFNSAFRAIRYLF